MIPRGEIMIKTHSMIMDELSEYKNPKTKLGRMVRDGIYTPIIRGIYETDPETPGYFLAGSIYGPSYLSFDFALSYYCLLYTSWFPVLRTSGFTAPVYSI